MGERVGVDTQYGNMAEITVYEVYEYMKKIKKIKENK